MQDIYDMTAGVPTEGGPTFTVRFAERGFSILQQPTHVLGECRPLGMAKLMSAIFRRVKAERPAALAGDGFLVSICCADTPLQHMSNSPTHLVFQTVGHHDAEDLFPDFIFGNWWHIGLRDFDAFAAEILAASAGPAEDKRCFWIGNKNMHPAREHYQNIADNHPDRLKCEGMTWGNGGSHPANFVPLKEHWRYKYLIDIEGSGWSGRLKLLPFCRRPLLVQERPWWSWADQQLVAGKHYWHVARDFSNLFDVLDTIDADPARAVAMVEAALAVAKEKFSFEAAVQRGTELILSRL